MQAAALREPRLNAPVLGKAGADAQEVQGDADDGLQPEGVKGVHREEYSLHMQSSADVILHMLQLMTCWMTKA
jgi:hypothetical protein